MRKRVIILGVICILITLFLYGCRTRTRDNGDVGGSDLQKSTLDDIDNKSEEVIIWYYWETESHQIALDAVIDSYNDFGEGTVTARYVPFADFKKQLSIGVSADELPDLVIIDMADHASYASMGIFADITDRVDISGYYEGPTASCMLDGRLYGIPFGSNCLALYYNTELLEAAGQQVPETWEELKSAAAALTEGDRTGLAFCCIQNEEGTFNFMPWIWAAGADADNIAAAGEAFALVGELTADGSMSREVISWTQGDIMSLFLAENIAMMVNGSWQVPTIRSEAEALSWGVVPIPADKEQVTALGGENYAVIAGKNEEGAIAFLEYATSNEQLMQLMEAFGYISAKTEVAARQYEGDDIMKVFTDQMETARARGPHADWPDISDAISGALNEVITGMAAPEEAAEMAQETINRIMNK